MNRLSEKKGRARDDSWRKKKTKKTPLHHRRKEIQGIIKKGTAAILDCFWGKRVEKSLG